ncbi:nucleotidyltransferase family protein [Caviibacterium pharyngocola]|uniref:Nucleotidyltransferase domain-containing protein n=1 Tax=Caviibacterium pharyngocola TaxID=28159 RepID=A0A2M8RVY0_9PAST|nr:nucleotidyltransferase domain-containing protein [Caviibacterium pharyngocola]PJG83033.1 nucleotidyltransferase domain-containing protein [Caviibacterium pharyngocola]
MNALKIKSEELEIVKAILQTFVPNVPVWAFGSRVKGTEKPYSDLDLAIITEKPLSLLEHANLVEAFSESDLPYKVDIVDWAITSDNFKQIIQQQYIIIQ